MTGDELRAEEALDRIAVRVLCGEAGCRQDTPCPFDPMCAADLTPEYQMNRILARIDELEGEVEGMKVCGNCGGSGHHGGAFGCFRDVDYFFIDTEPSNHCHYDPSGWTPREQGEGT